MPVARCPAVRDTALIMIINDGYPMAKPISRSRDSLCGKWEDVQRDKKLAAALNKIKTGRMGKTIKDDMKAPLACASPSPRRWCGRGHSVLAFEVV